MKKNTLAENMQRFGTKNLDEAGKFYKGSRYNDEPFKFGDDKRSLATKTNPEWDAFVDKYNNTPGFETSTSADGTSYKAEITNLESGLKWVVMNQKGNNWSYVGRDPSYLGNPEFCRDAKELIANFEEINGTSMAENMRRFGTKNLKEDGDQNNDGYPDETEKIMMLARNKGSKFVLVTPQVWNDMDEDAQANALLSVVKDPDEAERYIGVDFNELPSEVTSNMMVFVRTGNFS